MAIYTARALRRRGHEVETWFFYRKVDAFTGEPGVRCLFEERPSGLQFISLLRKLTIQLRANRPDAVIAYTHYATVVGLLVAWLVGVPSRIASMQRPAPRYPGIVKAFNVLLGSIGCYSHIAAVSHSVAESCSAYPQGYRRRLRVVLNGVPRRESKLSQAEARARYGVQGAERLLVSLGRLHPAKNQQFLVRLLVGLPQWRLLIAGDGPLRATLETLADTLGVRDRLTLLGAIPGEDVPNVLRCADVFVSSSLYEGFGLVLVEAMWAGVPIIASAIPASREVLMSESAEPAGLALPLDLEMWERAIHSLGEGVLRGQLVARGIARAGDFTVERMAETYESLMLSGRASG